MVNCLTCLSSLLIILHGVCCAHDWTPYGKLPSYEIGDVYSSTHSSRIASVRNKAECALLCNEMGNETCLSFNVIPVNSALQCETFDHRPTTAADLISSPGGVFYEELCASLTIKVAFKETLLDNDILVTLVDDKQRVYHVRQSSPKFNMIGHVEDVFKDFTGTIDGVSQAYLWPYGDTHLIRQGLNVHCYVAMSPQHNRFVRFPLSQDTFPTPFFSLFPRPYGFDTRHLRFVASDRLSKVIFGFDFGVLYTTFTRGDSADWSIANQLAHGDPQVFNCEKSKWFCPIEPFFQDATSGIHMSANIWGVFNGRYFYTIDLTVKDISVLERHMVCMHDAPTYVF